jgi:hypothetical protein
MGLFELIVIVVALSTVGSIVKSVLSYRVRRLPAVDRDALQRIEETLAELRDNVAAVRENVAELEERMDFTERVLARNREGELRLGQGPATPP